jgi:NAD(P)-dependent dehydrogenase (short-subunit alcohol dehydrogenase family)
MHYPGRFAGKRAIITGASRGIGKAVALRFALEGGRAGLISPMTAELEEVAAQIRDAGGEALVLTADVSQEDQVMALDYAPHNIRVNACIPGFIDTPMNAHVMSDAALLETWTSTIPIKRVGSAEETAAVILFLASDEASYVVGSAFVVDGGQMAG